MFDTDDLLAFFMRLCSFSQIFTSSALLFACLRCRIIFLITGHLEVKSDFQNILISILILILPLVLAIFYPFVGRLAG